MIDLLVKYALDPALQKRVAEYIAKNKREKDSSASNGSLAAGWRCWSFIVTKRGR